MSNDNIIIQLDFITQQINRYVSIFLFIFGIFGNLLNCLVFTRQTLRSNPCSIYFLVASLFNLIVIITAFLPLIIDGWNIQFDLKETISALCKFTIFLLLSSRNMVSWLIVLATIDRYLVSSSNVHRRQLSNLKNTYRSILIIFVIFSIIWFEVLVCFDANMIGTPLKCYPKSTICQRYNDFAQALIVIIIPIIIMLFFGFSTIKNIHQSGRIAPNSNNGHAVSRNRRHEINLTKMLLIQVLVLVLLTLPFAIMTFYLSFTFYQEKSMIQLTIEGFVFNILLQVTYISNCISFFLYTLSGSLFRETFIQVGKKIIRYLGCFH